MTTLEMLEAVVKNPGTKYASNPTDALITLHEGILMRCFTNPPYEVSVYDIKPREIPSWIADDVQWELVKEPRVIKGTLKARAKESGMRESLPALPEGTWDIEYTATEIL